jgi:hypothetical protein
MTQTPKRAMAPPMTSGQSGRVPSKYQGVRTEIVSASILSGDDLAGYDPAQDADLYEYFLAEEQE